MAALSDILTFSRQQAQTDSNGLTDAKGIVWGNEALLDFHRRLIAGGIDASQVQEAYDNMAANTGTYLWPTDMWWLKTIELNYSGNVAQNFITAQQADVSNLPNLTSFGWLRSNASTAAPFFDDRGDWYEIFPTPVGAVSGGIRIFYFLEPTQFTAVGDTLAYPVTLDYTILGWRIAANYKRSLSDFESAVGFDAEYEKKVKDMISTLSRGAQQPLTASPIALNGWEF